MRTCVLFGGTGFIGSALARFFINEKLFDLIVLADLVPISDLRQPYRKNLLNHPNIMFTHCDVRTPIGILLPEGVEVTLVMNLAAIHREPGHQAEEYFSTNLKGAEHVCDYARNVNCAHVIFLSSIATYGSDHLEKTEASLTMPLTPYGISKLLAEKKHEIWQAEEPAKRVLTVIRPGVVFGPGEEGNVTRMVKAISRRYFFFAGNKSIPKAGIYVKELCRAIWWAHAFQIDQGKGVDVFNMSMDPVPVLRDYADAIVAAKGRNFWIPEVPFISLLLVSKALNVIWKFIKRDHPFDPVRVLKLKSATNVKAFKLVISGYKFEFNMREAMTDWRYDCPRDWSEE